MTIEVDQWLTGLIIAYVIARSHVVIYSSTSGWASKVGESGARSGEVVAT